MSFPGKVCKHSILPGICNSSLCNSSHWVESGGGRASTATTKDNAARKAGISHATLYRRLADPRFMTAFRAARRQVFDDALFCLERNAPIAAQALADEIGDDRTGEYSRISAATRVLDFAFKAQGTIAVEAELSHLREKMAGFKAGQTPVIVEKLVEVKPKMTEHEQADACRLRMEWMGELGHPLEDITTSLRYNRPQSVAEEQELLDVVRTQLEWERKFTGALE